jgi:hypothetical protein
MANTKKTDSKTTTKKSSSGATIKPFDGKIVPFGSGSKSLSAVLDRVRITTTSGSPTFDNGEINIAYI